MHNPTLDTHSKAGTMPLRRSLHTILVTALPLLNHNMELPLPSNTGVPVTEFPLPSNTEVLVTELPLLSNTVVLVMEHLLLSSLRMVTKAMAGHLLASNPLVGISILAHDTATRQTGSDAGLERWL
jgi:hypothetical protein